MKKEMQKYIDALNRGSEIVVINDDAAFNSAIFWKNREGCYFSFCKTLGEMARDDIDDAKFVEHLEELKTEGVRLFIRGYEEW